jgi:Ca2+-binding RTX toxin-like protein
MASYSGSPSADSIFGGDSNDTFDYSQGGNDTVWGGGGDDVIYFGAEFTSGDQVNGEDGADTLALEGDYSGGLVFDGVNVRNVETIAFLNFSKPQLKVMDGIVGTDETLAIHNDDSAPDKFVLEGSSLVHTALDVVTVGNVDQHVYGGALNDTLTLLNGIDRSDVFDLGDGYDVLHCQGAFLRAAGRNFRNIEEITFANNASVTFNELNIAAGETLTVRTSSFGSSLVGKRETDGHFHMIGGTGVDGLYGGHQADTLEGGGGNDSIHGGRGADVLSGGAGDDQFFYDSFKESLRGQADVITDLENGDTITLSFDADTKHDGYQFLQRVDHFTGHAGELTFAYNAETGYTRIAADVNGDHKADMVILIEGDHSDFTGLVF